MTTGLDVQRSGIYSGDVVRNVRIPPFCLTNVSRACSRECEKPWYSNVSLKGWTGVLEEVRH